MSYKTVTLADGRVVDVDHIVDNPEAYGFVWEYGHLNKRSRGRVTNGRGAPWMKHMDEDVIRSWLGKHCYRDNANGGQSFKVQAQTLRDVLAENIRLRSDDRGMKRWVVEKTLGILDRKPSTTVVYDGMDGAHYTDRDARDAADLATMHDNGVPTEIARAIIDKRRANYEIDDAEDEAEVEA